MSTTDDICGTYTLTHCDGKAAPTKALLTIFRSGETVVVHITVANDLRGKVQYENRVISGQLRRTNNDASEEQKAVEEALDKGFADGFNVVIEVDQLLLKNASNSFVFARSAKLSDLTGEHAIIAVNNQPPNQEMTMRFVPDGNGGSFVIANIANSLRGDCQIDAGLLRGDVASSVGESDETMAYVEKVVSDGLRKGFRVSKNESGIVLQSSKAVVQLCQIVSHNDLQGEYVLKTYNGYAVPTRNQTTVVFKPANANDVEISIVVANRIRGTATLSQNVLTSEEPLMSTRMMGTEEESQLEGAFNVGFQYGLEAISRGNELTLKNQDCEFVLVRAVAPEAQHVGPTYKGTYCNKCFKTEGNGLLFRVVNEHEKKWAFYNDTEDFRMHIQATFGARSQIEPLDNATMSQTEDGRYVVEVTVEPQTTEMFIHGDVNGFKVLYNAQPV